MEYTSRGVGNAALATGIIGTTLGALDEMDKVDTESEAAFKDSFR